MISSMTGFGKTDNDIIKETNIITEISSVNKKQLEIRLNLPSNFSNLDSQLRKLISSCISRGTINVKIQIATNSNSCNSVINKELLKSLAQEIIELQKDLNLQTNSIDLSQLFHIPGVMVSNNLDIENLEVQKQIFTSLENALKNFNLMRQREGEELANDLRLRCQHLEDITEKIIPLAEQVPINIRKKLLSKLENENFNIDLNDDRLLKEILFYVDKSDVTEEITRLKSHFLQLKLFLQPTSQQTGRSMDFLLQEISREITTLANKSGNSGISPLAVEFKAEMEKIREQIQNIE